MAFQLTRLGAAALASFLMAAQTTAFAQTKKPAQPATPRPTPAQPAPPAGNQPAPAQPSPGTAAPQQPPGPIKLDLIPTQNDWTKVCGDDPTGKHICYTTRDFSMQPQQGQQAQPPVLALAVYDIKGNDTRILRLLVPVGLLLKPGFRFAVDKSPAQQGTYEICFPNGCFAEATINGQLIDQLKKATTLSVAVKRQDTAEVNFMVPLAGFGKAFDGPPIDPKVLEEQQKKLQEELQKRAEEERKRIESQKPEGASQAPAAPAPAAPAPK